MILSIFFLLAFCISSLVKCLVKSFVSFSIGLFLFSLYYARVFGYLSILSPVSFAERMLIYFCIKFFSFFGSHSCGGVGGRERDWYWYWLRFSISGITPKLDGSWVGPGWSQETGGSFRSSVRMTGAQTLGPSAAFSRPLGGSWIVNWSSFWGPSSLVLYWLDCVFCLSIKLYN